MWKKKGLIYSSDGQWWWNKTHAQVPVVDDLGDRLRIYYAARNEDGKSRTSFIECDAACPEKILYRHNEPILPLGNPGTFDDSGIMPTCIVNHNGKKYLYYIGWTIRASVPFQNSIGLAVSDDGIRFDKMYEGPLIGLNRYEPYFTGTAWIMANAQEYWVYYLSCIGWELLDGKFEPLYELKLRISEDGIGWSEKGVTVISLEKDEGGLASATVNEVNGTYHMWFSVRMKSNYRNDKNNTYRIGYAQSKDGKAWERNDDKAGLTKSEEGWDSQMQAYPYVIRRGNQFVMFYNGNGFGRSGFGYATCDVNDLP